jgi:DNA-binding CsgD family transcriptional regulator
VALTTETIILAGDRWGVVPITIGAIIVFALNATIVSDLYRGATAGLLLAVTGIVAWAGMRLTAGHRQPLVAAMGVVEPPQVRPPDISAPSLTPRELEVLRAVAGGARSARIASDLGIAERTVKAHLASIYQKLGVESRAAAVAIAVQRGMASPERDRG